MIRKRIDIVDWILFLTAVAIVAAVLIGSARTTFGDGGYRVSYDSIRSAQEIGFQVSYGENPYAPQPVQPPQKQPASKLPKVYVVYAPFYCIPCNAQRADLKNWKPKEFEIEVVSPAQFPIPIPSYPCTAWKSGVGTWEKITGWAGRDSLLLKWRASQMVLNNTATASAKATSADFEELNASSVTPAQFALYNASQLRSFAHSYNGPMTRMARKRDSYWYHLLDHGFAQWQIQGLNEWEASKIHGAVHAGLISPTYQVRQR